MGHVNKLADLNSKFREVVVMTATIRFVTDFKQYYFTTSLRPPDFFKVGYKMLLATISRTH